MIVKKFEFNPLSENTFVVYDDTKECIVIDPGCYEKEEKNTLRDFISEYNLTIKKLINTHCHIDHVLGNNWVKNEYNVGLIIHKLDEPTLKSNEMIAPIYGFQAYEPTDADSFLEEGDEVKFGNTSLEVLFVPGHCPC